MFDTTFVSSDIVESNLAGPQIPYVHPYEKWRPGRARRTFERHMGVRRSDRPNPAREL